MALIFNGKKQYTIVYGEQFYKFIGSQFVPKKKFLVLKYIDYTNRLFQQKQVDSIEEGIEWIKQKGGDYNPMELDYFNPERYELEEKENDCKDI